jgi:hypothetical protein
MQGYHNMFEEAHFLRELCCNETIECFYTPCFQNGEAFLTQCVPNLNPFLKTICIKFSNCGNEKPESLPKIIQSFERNVYLETILFEDHSILEEFIPKDHQQTIQHFCSRNIFVQKLLQPY